MNPVNLCKNKHYSTDPEYKGIIFNNYKGERDPTFRIHRGINYFDLYKLSLMQGLLEEEIDFSTFCKTNKISNDINDMY